MAHEADASTWHHGLVARWWAEFRWDGDDIACFRRAIERGGTPALDLACGTGRLLLPFLRDGLDVDGCDVSADMLGHCARRAQDEGLTARLFEQRMSELALPRRYRTVVICQSFGVGTTRSEDLEALRRIRDHLEPGGSLVFDIDLPNFASQGWGAWLPESRPRLPTPWPPRGDRRVCADGSELELKGRVLAFDPLEQTSTRALRVEHWVDGELHEAEERSIRLNIYFKNEVELMLRAAGFSEVRVTGDLTDEAVQPYEHERVFFHAIR